MNHSPSSATVSSWSAERIKEKAVTESDSELVTVSDMNDSLT